MPEIKVHIFSTEQVYNTTLLEFFKKELKLKDHYFVFLTKSKKGHTTVQNNEIIYKPGYPGLLQAIKLARKSDFIFFHSLPMGPKLLVWALFPSLFKKSAWIYWGADVYAFKNRNKNIKQVIYDYCRKKIIKEIPHIAGFLEGDFRIIKENYLTNADYHHVVYQIPTSFELIDSLSPKLIKRGDTKIKILLGNSGSQTNMHLEAFERLKKFKTKNIEIICPLSYGIKQRSYLNQIVSRGKEIFGERFIALQEFLNPSDYIELLYDIDIAIMNHNRQEALGNIISLLYLGKKVYIKPETTSFDFFKKLNIKVFDINEINEITFDEFCNSEQTELCNNAGILKNELSQENYIKWWKELTNLS